MKHASLITQLFGAIVAGVFLSHLALSNGVISTAKLEGFDHWFCQQVWFKEQAQCRQQKLSMPELAIDLDKLNHISIVEKFGNWEMDSSPASQARAIKEIVLVRTLVDQMDLRRELKISVLARTYAKYWMHYPEFVVASRCISCGEQRSVLKKLGSGILTHTDFLTLFALSNAEMLPFLERGNDISQEHLGAVKLMAELLYNGGSHSRISPIMLEQKEWTMVHANIVNGGAYGALADADLEDIPHYLIVEAWEKSLSRGSFESRLTKHLLAKGYRPALRLAVWLRAGQYDYLKYSRAKDVIAMLPNYADFGELEGEALAKYYSKNWRNIRWDESSLRWRSN